MKKKNLKKTQKLKIMAALLSGGMLAVLSPNAAYALEGTADNNYTVTITDTMNITGNVYGNKGNILADKNCITGHVQMSGGKVNGEIYGGYYNDTPDTKYYVKVAESTVTISGGEVIGNIYGGRGYFGKQNKIDNRDAVDNKVYITGGKITGNIYGGYGWGGRPNKKPH